MVSGKIAINQRFLRFGVRICGTTDVWGSLISSGQVETSSQCEVPEGTIPGEL